MNGDFTRDTFNPANHFSRVLMQQGRVQLDADWNEQTAILLHYMRTLAMDILGAHAGPGGAWGFEIITKTPTPDWNARKDKWNDIGLTTDRINALTNAIDNNNNAIIDAGRYYVNGILVENHYPILYTEQPSCTLGDKARIGDLRGTEGLFYLDVWERHITYVQDDHIREVALNGADTCTRAQVVWQVKFLDKAQLSARADDRLATHMSNKFNALEGLLGRKTEELPLLRARAKTPRGAPSPELCAVSPESRYRGLENRLYRVEVHAAGTGMDEAVNGTVGKAVATFKWSRDNASVVFPIVSLDGTTAIVANLRRDQCAQLKPGDWVEVCDDDFALREQSRPLAKVATVDRDENKVTLTWPNGVSAERRLSYDETATRNKHPLLRRWDHDGSLAKDQGALPVTESDSWIPLEDGVEIQFAQGGQYRVGDYWLIPARVATGDVEWPKESLENGSAPTKRPPHGPKHHYAPLLYQGSDAADNKDCRCEIIPGAHCPKK